MNQTSRRAILSRMMKAKFLTTAIATTALIAYTGSSVKAAFEDSPKTLVDEVWQIVHSEFVDRGFNHVDWLNQRQVLLKQDYVDNKAAYTAIRESLKTLGDPYTRFLNPEEFAELTSQTSGELSGIGIRLSLDEKTSELTVVEPITNSPADKAGIKTGDRILAIDGKPTSLMSLEQASAEIKGEVGTQINLKISRLGKEAFDLTLVREQIELPSVDYTLSEAGQTKVGYIKLDEFSSHAAEQMEKAIEDLNQKQVTGFVLDLRGNPGGLLFS
jgi:carboxyl-terminal processing protease